MNFRAHVLLCPLLAFFPPAFAQPTTLTVDASAPGKAISRDLVGVFFEDPSHAADDGFLAELVRNRSFEYSTLARRERDDRPPVARPETARVPVSSEFVHEIPANSPALLPIPSTR